MHANPDCIKRMKKGSETEFVVDDDQDNTLCPEYVFVANKIRGKMLKLLSNQLYFCIAGDRNHIAKEL